MNEMTVEHLPHRPSRGRDTDSRLREFQVRQDHYRRVADEVRKLVIEAARANHGHNEGIESPHTPTPKNPRKTTLTGKRKITL